MQKTAAPKGEHKARPRKPRRSSTTLAIKPEGNPVVWFAIWPAVAALVAFYIAGWNTVAPGLVLVLAALTFASETIKTQLGALAEESFAEGRKGRGWAFLLGAVACVVWGVISGVVAISSLDAPRKAYEAAQANLAVASAPIKTLRAQIAALPACTPEMPATRCKQMEESNAKKEVGLLALIKDAEPAARSAKLEAEKHPDPGPGLPSLPLWLKALASLFIEYLLVAIPWANAKPAARLVRAASPLPKPKAIEPQTINDGGWKKRRERYGPTGRRQPLRLVRSAG